MTPAQQKKAIGILKDLLKMNDESDPGPTGYDDHEDTMEIRMLLIECGAIPDRRKARKK